jgi:hypothetical protein
MKRILINFTPRKYYWNEQVKEEEMKKACSTHGIEEQCI